jgi:hypothetical protein
VSAHKWTEIVRVELLFVLGLALALYYARMGFMPLDQSIVFDGGWRILCGQVPFRDYTAPNGFVPHAMQALFFTAFGVTWFSYCMHAAVINGLFVVLVDRLLVLLGLETWASSIFALCSAVVFYPAFGVPYMDQHAFFFSLAALVLAVAGAQSKREGVRRVCWIAVPPMLALAYLSKQIPSVFFLPAVFVIAACAPIDRGKALLRLALSSFAVFLLLMSLAMLLRVDWHLVDTYWRRLPAEEGARRIAFLHGSVFERFAETRRELGLWSITVVHAFGLIGVLAALVASATMLRQRDWPWSRAIAAVVLGEALLLACLGFVALTSNQKAIGVPLVFASLGLIAAAAPALARVLAAGGLEKAPVYARWVVLALALIAGRDAWKFQRDVVATRAVSDLQFDPVTADAQSHALPADLEFMRWSVPKNVQYSAQDLHDVAQFLCTHTENFFLLGDASVLYGLARKPSIAPSLWFHPGLTIPLPQDPEFTRYERALLDRIESEHVRLIVLEGAHTWIGYQLNPGEKPPKAGYVTLDTFPKLAALVAARKSGERDFGAFKVIELRPD